MTIEFFLIDGAARFNLCLFVVMACVNKKTKSGQRVSNAGKITTTSKGMTTEIPGVIVTPKDE